MIQEILEKFFTHLKCPSMFSILVSVVVNVALRQIVTSELHISHPVKKELRHPEHVTAGRIQESNPLLAQNCLDLGDNAVQNLDHVSGVLLLTSYPTNCVVVIRSTLSSFFIIILEVFLADFSSFQGLANQLW